MKNLSIRDIIRPVVLLCAVLSVAVCLLAGMWDLHLALVLACGLFPLVALLSIRVHRTVHFLYTRARYHADTAAEAERHYFHVMRGIVQVVEARDKITAGRSERIGRLAERIALSLGLGEARATLLGMIGQVHDIGMLAVPERILHQPTSLTGGEFRTVQLHPEVGHRVLKPLTFLGEVLDAVRYHHERMNGTGYPKGLVGQDIPLEARILAVAESFDAITRDRPHRMAMTGLAAMAEMIRCCDGGYDRDCVIALAHATNLSHLLPAEWTMASGSQDSQPADPIGQPVPA